MRSEVEVLTGDLEPNPRGRLLSGRFGQYADRGVMAGVGETVVNRCRMLSRGVT